MNNPRWIQWMTWGFLLIVLPGNLFSNVPGVQAGGAEYDRQINLVARKLKYHPDEFTVKQGQIVLVVLRNEGFVSHNVVVPDLGITSDTIQPGEQTTVRIRFSGDPGTYEFRCTVAEHHRAGMKGTITVKE